ncbi:S-adenosyl-L-methionine-dependent methyltransferases superfamily protein [Tanacetum coccineum]
MRLFKVALFAIGSIAEGYVAEEALTFCSRYLKDVETRFNRPGRNDDVLKSSETLAYREESPDNVETSFPAVFHYKTTTSLEGRQTCLSSRCAEVDQDVIHGSSSSHVTLSVGLTCLEHTDLSINAQSTEVDAPLVNDDNANANKDNDDFINNEDDVVAHVLDDDDVEVSDDDESKP